MDERLQNLLDSVQKTATEVGNSASDVAYDLSKKASQLLSVGKLNVQIADLKAEINLQLREVGEMIYATHTGTPTESDALLGKLEEIDRLYARMNALSAQIAALRGSTVCPNCGAPSQKGDAFCRDCGGKL